MKVQVKIRHFRPCYTKGDLDSELVTINALIFDSKKAAKDYIEKAVRGKDAKISKSGAIYFTGKKWVEENTGEEREEYKEYIITKP